jgi:glutaredoxin
MGEFFQEIGEEVRTVPQIMVDKRLIGGYNELMKYLNNNDENPRYSLNGSDI